MLRPRVVLWLAVFPATGAIFGAGACGNGAVGVNECRSIEEARCRQAPACGISLEPPYDTSGSAVDACIRYYQVACLHGLAVPDPGQASVNACVAAINSGDCSLVQAPVTGACAWLAPSSSSSSAVVTDAAADSEDDGTGSPDGEASAD
ncbi:MAG TPA: hypothetical protein VEK07_09020 [Polyangiaceae bacterium]|nr:hypothetical protein [Polyangiaceae bacterium]